MKFRILLIIALAIVLLESCTKFMSPYEAANHPRGRKCATIR